MPTRRTFAKAAAGSVAALSAASYRAVAGANGRVQLGFVGVGNRGDQLLDAFLAHPDCAPAALCDVYAPYLAAAKAKAGGAAQTFEDYRKLLELKGLDAVVVATPDHWHALQFVDACRAGKDVYVEKPVSLTIGEGRVMCRVAEETRRITQVGLHRRSVPYVMEAVKLIQDGAIGKVTAIRAHAYRNESPAGIGKPADGAPPEGLNWDLWQGPAPAAAFNANKCLYKFRWFPAYSGGQITNLGTHYVDVAQWALRQDAPKAVACLGGRYAVDDNREIPDTLEAIWEYDGCLVTFSQLNGTGAQGNKLGTTIEFRGTLGTLYLWENDQGFEIVPENVRIEELPALNPLTRAETRRQGKAVKPARAALAKRGPFGDVPHARTFLDAVKSRVPGPCPIEVGHRSTTATLLGKLALERGRLLTWDAKAERVTNDEAANARLSYEYRAPWKLG